MQTDFISFGPTEFIFEIIEIQSDKDLREKKEEELITLLVSDKIYNSIVNSKLAIKDGKITFGYGARYTGANAKKGRHKGVDFATKSGTPVYAAVAGKVQHSGSNGFGPTRGWGSAYGIQVIVANNKFADGSRGYYAGYMHLSKVKVKRGQVVKKGQLIGYTGNTGSSTATSVTGGAIWTVGCGADGSSPSSLA